MSSTPSSRPARCLITGASGFIGSRLCERLSEQKSQSYRALVRRPEAANALRALGAEVAVGDLMHKEQLAQALQGCDAVVHLAQGGNGPIATRHLLEQAMAARVKRFVHISTMSVHGPSPGPECAHESSAKIGRYQQEYCDSKAEQEDDVQRAFDRGDLQGVILRPTVVYGPHAHFVMQVIEQAKQGKVSLFDQGSGLCNAVYIDDVCDAIAAALTNPKALGQAMFINADKAITWHQFIHAFAEMVKPRPEFINLSAQAATDYWLANPPPQPPRHLLDRIVNKLRRMLGPAAKPSQWPALGRVQREMIAIEFSNARAKELLDWTPQVHFETGVARTRHWLQQAGHIA